MDCDVNVEMINKNIDNINNIFHAVFFIFSPIYNKPWSITNRKFTTKHYSISSTLYKRYYILIYVGY